MELFYTDKILENDKDFQEFIRNSPSKGFVKVRASSAYEAVPVEGLDVKITKKIGNNIIIFYEGKTDHSGMINNIVLPAPMGITDDLMEPVFADYKLEAIKGNFDGEYSISVCCGITVIQYINVIPSGDIRIPYGN